MNEEMFNRVRKTIELIDECGGYDGAHHKQWVLDQVVRTLLGEEAYEFWVKKYRDGEDGPDTYEWDEGIAP